MPSNHRADKAAVLLRSSGIFAIGLAALLVALAIIAFAWMARDGRIQERSEPTFSTTASGTVDIPASSATTRVGLRACGAGPGEALQRLNGRFAGMSKAWRDQDVPKADIARGELRTYRASRTSWCSTADAVVTVDDLDLVDEVLAGIASYPRGIQSLEGPTFDYDSAKLEEEALDEAMRVARHKADDAAKRAGTRVTGVRSIEEGLVEVTRPEDRGREQFPNDGMYASGGSSTVSVSASVQKSVSTAISRNPGRATATVGVDAVFELDED